MRVSLRLTAICVTLLFSSLPAEDIVVNIVGPGGRAKYIEEGQTEQKPIKVKIGDRIQWVNHGDRTHTATASRLVNERPLFDTDDIRQGESSGFIEMTQEVFDNAGGQPQGSVTLAFECLYHPAMQSEIELRDVGELASKTNRRTRASAARGLGSSVMTRKNVSSLTTAELASLRRGVEVMKSRPVTDRTSWEYWANIHGVPGTATDPLWDQCEHGTLHFLTWHRAYLYHFELVLREASGDPNFTLPYWDWNRSRTVPVSYRSPADSSNSLWERRRRMNDGSSLSSSLVVTDLNNAMRQRSFPIFSSMLENSPHGTVHTTVGGTGGTMSSIGTSANDPLFWAHHANVDRLWSRWLDVSGHANPSDSEFLDQQFDLVTAGGANASMRVRDLLTTAALQYRYDDDPPLPPPTLAQMAASASDDATPLGFEPHTVKAALPEAVAARLRTNAASPAPIPRTWIDIRGIRFSKTPNFVYGVYVNLPEGEDNQERLDAHYVGSISLFGRDPQKGGEHAAKEGLDYSLDATETINRLKDMGVDIGSEVKITLRPIATIPPKGREALQRSQDRRSAEEAKVTYESITLRSTPE